MGLSFSCPFAAYTDLDSALKSINLEQDDEVKKFSEPLAMELMGSQVMKFDKSVSFKVSSHVEKTELPSESPRSVIEDHESGSPKHEAATKLQKVYKSFRTRRKLADCAVLIEQSWWKLLDFAELKRSSISFFDLDKQETAISRWSRARTRAAKVGKGLSKNSKAQKLALQHWLEAIDPRHRYGHNLHFYYLKWLQSQSKEPFFYWLDIGEGKEVNLVDKCPRTKLQQQCIKYLGPMERREYEVAIENGKLLYKQTGEYVDTTGSSTGSKWIFVLSTSKTLYVGIKKKGLFQHSSFLAGGATLAAGRLVSEKGILKAIWPHSGHYRPTQENFQDFVSFLQDNDVDTTYVKMDSDEDDNESSSKQGGSLHIRTHSSEEDVSEKERIDTEDVHVDDHISKVALVMKQITNLPLDSPKKSRLSRSSSRKLNTLDAKNQADEATESIVSRKLHYNMSDDETEPSLEETVPKKSILRRIGSHKGTKSFQLGRQLSCKWSTGAGPRIGCLRDYPTELQSHALEQANLSPKSAPCSHKNINKTFFARNCGPYRTNSSPSQIGEFTGLFY